LEAAVKDKAAARSQEAAIFWALRKDRKFPGFMEFHFRK
jgi:hypothetical protein